MNAPVAVFRHHATPMPEKSSGIRAETDFGINSGNVGRLQKAFPAVFAKWLSDHFRDKEHVAYFFDRDERTARNWLSGLNCPSGPIAVAVILQFPDLRARLLAEVAA